MTGAPTRSAIFAFRTGVGPRRASSVAFDPSKETGIVRTLSHRRQRVRKEKYHVTTYVILHTYRPIGFSDRCSEISDTRNVSRNRRLARRSVDRRTVRSRAAKHRAWRHARAPMPDFAWRKAGKSGPVGRARPSIRSRRSSGGPVVDGRFVHDRRFASTVGEITKRWTSRRPRERDGVDRHRAPAEPGRSARSRRSNRDRNRSRDASDPALHVGLRS